KEENATVTGVFNLTESEENLSAEVTVSGTLTCIVPGKDGDYINSQFTQVLQFPNSNTAKKVLSESVLKGSTCTVTVNNVQVPEGWEWNLPNPVVQKVTENTEVQVAVDALPPAPKPAPEQKPAPSEPAPSEPAPAPESETESEPVPPVMPEQPAPSVPVVPETPVAPESVAPVETPADSSETGARTLVNTGAGGTIVPLLGGVFALLGASVVIATARRRSSRA
ncbi:hypothetical protein KJY78_06315, partial [Canibacter sp. lx-45]|nr:hypothetical protein [Canibacter zhuwentaonis]